MAGKGSIRQHRGAWEVRVSAGRTVDGKQRIITRRLPSRRMAEAARVQILRELEAGKRAPRRSDPTLWEVVETWLEQGAPDWTSKTIAGYRSDVGRIPAALRAKKVTAVTAGDLDAVYAMLRRRLTSASVQRTHQAIRSALETARRHGLVDRNVAFDARRPTSHRAEVHDIAFEDYVTVLGHLPSEALRRAAAVAVSTGMRQGEQVAMQVGDAVGAKLRVARTLQVGPSGLEVGSTKTHRSRPVVLSEQVQAILAAQAAAVVDDRAQGVGRGPWLWSHDGGETPWRPGYVSLAWQRARDRANVARAAAAREAGVDAPAPITMRWHDLRHLHASLLLADGVPIVAVAAQLGHARTSTTLDFYGQVIAGSDSGIGATIERALGPAVVASPDESES